MGALLCGVFFLSGAAALLFETLWFHQAGLALGSSVWASALVLAGFMGGLALGNGLIGALGHRIRRPVRLYGLLEIAIAASGVALVHALPGVGSALSPLLGGLADTPWLLNPLRLGLAFALLLVPSTAMGATLPLLVAALYRRDPRFGRSLGLLYGWNTLGAVAGALAGEAFLIGWLGIRGSALVAASANGAAALLALAAAQRLDAATGPARECGRPLSGRARAFLAAAFVLGAVLLALEVVWFRLLLLKVHGSSLAFSIMLAVVLAGIALGGLVGSRWLARSAAAARGVAALAFGSAVLCVATYALHGTWLDAHPGVVYRWPAIFALAGPLMLPVAFLSGVLFTLLGEAIHREGTSETRAAGLLTLANTAGAMLGPVVGGFALLPLLGVERSIQVLAAAYGLVAVLLAWAGPRPESGRGRVALGTAAALGLAALFVFPGGILREHYLADTLKRFRRIEGARPVAVREGPTETSVVLQTDLFGEPLYRRLVTNSYSMSSTQLGALRYMKLFVWWPVALHPDPRRALLISYGVGTTARALADTASLEEIDVVDISRDILQLDEVFFPDPASRPLRDPRVRVHVEDGRHFLQTRDARWDVITAEPPPPKAAGVVNLYSQEYFELLRSRLRDGGIVTYWIPVHTVLETEGKAIMRAFCNAFDDCSLWSGSALDWMLVGTRNARGPVALEHYVAQWRDPVVGPQLREAGLETPEQLATLFLFDSPDLAARTRGVAPLVDDRPRRLGHTILGGRKLAPTWVPWPDVRASARRFARSEGVARLFPPAIRNAAGEWFASRDAAHRRFLAPLGEDGRLRRAHALLEETPLVTAPLWELGGGVERAAAARRARSAGRDGPAIRYELGLEALAQRRWGDAADLLAGSGPGRGDRIAAAILETYALCRASRPDAARARSAELDAEDLRGLRRMLAPACLP